MKSIEARDRVAVGDKLTQGVLPLYQEEVAQQLTEEKRWFLSQLMTDVDGNVHAFTDKMPGVLAGMLTARSSRSPEPDITEVLWQEFLLNPDLRIKAAMEEGADGISSVLNTDKAHIMTRRILERFGDDSVREDASGYLAISDVSVAASMEALLHKQLTAIEMSTRYVDWREKDVNGQYHYVVPETIKGGEYELIYREAMDSLFETYGELWQPVWDYFVKENPMEEGWSESAYETAVRGAVCDVLRKLLPLGIKTNFVLHAHYRTLSEVVMNLRASESAESRKLGDQMAAELLKVNPKFIEMVDGPHGAKWVEYKQNERKVLAGTVGVEGASGHSVGRGVDVRVLNWDYMYDLTRSVVKWQNPGLDGERLEDLTEQHYELNSPEKLAAELEEIRTNRRHKPHDIFQGIVLEVDYMGISFSGYKDLKRHRNLELITPPDWSGRMGYYVPEAILKIGGEVEAKFRKAQEISTKARELFAELGYLEEAKLLLTHGLKTNFSAVMGLQQSIWIEELRSIASGDPEYRWFAQEENRQRCEAMPELSKLGGYVDFEDYPLGRIREAVRADLKGKK